MTIWKDCSEWKGQFCTQKIISTSSMSFLVIVAMWPYGIMHKNGRVFLKPTSHHHLQSSSFTDPTGMGRRLELRRVFTFLYGYQKSQKRTNISGKGNLNDIDVSVSINKVCFGWSLPCLLRVCLALLSCPESRGEELDRDQIWLRKPKIFTVLQFIENDCWPLY